MIDFFKELIERPESTKKYIISLVKVIIASIITSKIYIKLYGSYNPILIGDNNYWHNIFDFIISGRVLIVVFLFFFVKLFILEFISIIITSLILILKKFKNKNKSVFKDSSLIKTLLIFFNAIKFDNEKEIIEVGNNFEYIYHFIFNYKEEELEDIFNDSFINTLLEIYCSFFILYIFLPEFHTTLLNVLIIITFILLVLIILILTYSLEFISLNYEEFTFGLKILKQIQLTKQLLSENKIKIDYEINKTFVNFITFKINGVEFGIEHYLGLKLTGEKIKESQLPENSKLILITSKKLPKILELKLKENSKLIIIEFNSDEDIFLNDLENVLFGK